MGGWETVGYEVLQPMSRPDGSTLRVGTVLSPAQAEGWCLGPLMDAGSVTPLYRIPGEMKPKGLTCEICGRADFLTAKAIRIHRSRAHAERKQ